MLMAVGPFDALLCHEGCAAGTPLVAGAVAHQFLPFSYLDGGTNSFFLYF